MTAQRLRVDDLVEAMRPDSGRSYLGVVADVDPAGWLLVRPLTVKALAGDHGLVLFSASGIAAWELQGPTGDWRDPRDIRENLGDVHRYVVGGVDRYMEALEQHLSEESE